MLTVISSLLLLFLAIPGSSGFACEWHGRAPFCGNTGCPSGFTQEASAKNASSSAVFGDFGKSCFSGEKRLCCREGELAKINQEYPSCSWAGTGPFCGGAQCREGFTEFIRSKEPIGASKGSIFEGFGKSCWNGDKALCCKHVKRQESKKECEWFGSAHLCGNNDCPEGKVEVRRSRNETSADFGKPCWTGQKTLCCNKPKGSGLIDIFNGKLN